MARKPIQTRRTEYASYRRDDGHFEIEGRLVDTDATSGRPIHVMGLRVIFDAQLVIRAIDPTLEATPFQYCHQGPNVFSRLIGEKISPGWKKRVAAVVSRNESCTHQLELLFNMATVAFQAVAIAPLVDGADPLDRFRHTGDRPYFLGGCKAWRLDGPLVAEQFPRFAQPETE